MPQDFCHRIPYAIEPDLFAITHHDHAVIRQGLEFVVLPAGNQEGYTLYHLR